LTFHSHRVLPEWYVHDLQEEKDSQNGQFGAANTKNTKKKVIEFDNMSAWERLVSYKDINHDNCDLTGCRYKCELL